MHVRINSQVTDPVTKAQRTRLRILDAAAACFAREGYAGASMARIAEEAGLKAGSLYFHVASKDELIGEVLREGVARTERHVRARLDALGPDADPGRRLVVAIEGHVAMLAAHGDYAAAVTRIVDEAPAAVRARHRARDRAYARLWRELLDAARAHGAIGDVDPRLARAILFAAMNGAHRTPALSPARLAAAIVELLRIPGGVAADA